jgi:ectoine hydroxylase-related dioxygenase (phytanoyl-CoA dioxygenase family)|tara:strand:+ start:278 stop:997 length:720 start_codon:yes stop_codon:yes gene_type:complete
MTIKTFSSFKDNGYLIVKDFISESEHKKLLEVCNKHYQSGKGGTKTSRFNYNLNGTMNKIEGACTYEPLFYQLACNKKLVEVAKSLVDIGDEVDVYISKFFPMEPNGGQSTFMHQDNFYFKGNPNEIISCAVYLEDTNKDNGCLRVAKGSHKNSIYPHKVNSGMSGIKWIDDNVLSEFEIIDLDDKAPYAVFFNINTIHGCYTNESENSRFSLAWEYISHYNSKVTNVNQPWCDRTKVV